MLQHPMPGVWAQHLWLTSMTPTMLPIMAVRLMKKQKTWRECIRIHLVDHLGMLCCAMCMQTGRNTVRGQKPSEPMIPAHAMI